MNIDGIGLKRKVEDEVCVAAIRSYAQTKKVKPTSRLANALEWFEHFPLPQPGSEHVDTKHLSREFKDAAAVLIKSAEELRKMRDHTTLNIFMRLLVEVKVNEGGDSRSWQRVPKVMQGDEFPTVLVHIARLYQTFGKHHGTLVSTEKAFKYVRRLPLLLNCKVEAGAHPDFAELERRLDMGHEVLDQQGKGRYLGLSVKTLRRTWVAYERGYMPRSSAMLEKLFISV